MEHSRGGAMAVIGRVAYGRLFCVALPALLILWGRATDHLVSAPVYGNADLAATAIGAGILLLAAGVRALWKRGGRLPMNAFPPPRLVVSGVYAIFPASHLYRLLPLLFLVSRWPPDR